MGHVTCIPCSVIRDPPKTKHDVTCGNVVVILSSTVYKYSTVEREREREKESNVFAVVAEICSVGSRTLGRLQYYITNSIVIRTQDARCVSPSFFMQKIRHVFLGQLGPKLLCSSQS